MTVQFFKLADTYIGDKKTLINANNIVSVDRYGNNEKNYVKIYTVDGKEEIYKIDSQLKGEDAIEKFETGIRMANCDVYGTGMCDNQSVIDFTA